VWLFGYLFYVYLCCRRKSNKNSSNMHSSHNNRCQQTTNTWNSNVQYMHDGRNLHVNNKSNKGSCQQQCSDAPAATEKQCDGDAFYCDQCNRGFNTERDYNQHTKRHEKCIVEGCSYAAAPALVIKHYRFHHEDKHNQHAAQSEMCAVCPFTAHPLLVEMHYKVCHTAVQRKKTRLTECTVDGCSFTATPKLVKMHYNLHHKTAQAKKTQLSGCTVEGCSFTATPKLVKMHYNLHHKTAQAKKTQLSECTVQGCSFTAELILVKMHYSMHHKTGLAERMSLSDRDLAQWISDRRTNFPTAQNTGRKTQKRKATEDVLHESNYSKIRHDSLTKLGERTIAGSSDVEKRAKMSDELEQQPAGSNVRNASHACNSGHQSKRTELLPLLDTPKETGRVSGRRKSSRSASGHGNIENVAAAVVGRADKGPAPASSDWCNSDTGLSVHSSLARVTKTAACSQHQELALERKHADTWAADEGYVRDNTQPSATRRSGVNVLTKSTLQRMTQQQVADFARPAEGRDGSVASSATAELGDVTCADDHCSRPSSSDVVQWSMVDSSTGPAKSAKKRHRPRTGESKAEVAMTNTAKAKVTKSHCTSAVNRQARNLSNIPVYSRRQWSGKSSAPLTTGSLCATRPSASLPNATCLPCLGSSGLLHRF